LRHEYGMGSIFFNCRLIGCKLIIKYAHSTILDTKVIMRQYRCPQKILWVRFGENYIGNYWQLMLNTNGARDQNHTNVKLFLKIRTIVIMGTILKFITWYYSKLLNITGVALRRLEKRVQGDVLKIIFVCSESSNKQTSMVQDA
jgi:hypothetical protein